MVEACKQEEAEIAIVTADFLQAKYAMELDVLGEIAVVNSRRKRNGSWYLTKAANRWPCRRCWLR